MSENKINRIKEYCKENIKENKKDKLQVVKEMLKISISFSFPKLLQKNKKSDIIMKMIFNKGLKNEKRKKHRTKRNTN